MNKNALKYLALGGAIVFLLLFGMELSTSGIERIYGPIDPDTPISLPQTEEVRYESETDKRIAELERELAAIRELAYGNGSSSELPERLPELSYGHNEPAVNKLADSTSGFLQSASSKSIRVVVSWFDGILN